MGALFSYIGSNAPCATGRRKEMSGTKILLFRLPASLFVQFLSEWLDIHDVGMLDTAMTNKGHRTEFLQRLVEMRNQTIPFSFSEFCEHHMNLLQWISTRHIHITTLSLPTFDENNEFIEGLRLPSLRKLVVSSGPWLRHIPKLSPSLEELSVGHFSSWAAMEDPIFVLSQCLELESVSIDSLIFRSRDWTDDVLAKLQEFGHLIVEIRSVDGYMKNVTTEGLMNFIKCCPRLRKLGYSQEVDNGMLLECVAQSCPLLEDIRFNTCSKLALLELSRNCKQLRKVYMCRFLETGVPASDLEALKQIDTLEELCLAGCRLTNKMVAVIKGFRHLRRLHLREYWGIDGLTGAGFRVLEGSPVSSTLQSISVKFETGGNLHLPVQGFDKAEMIAGIASCHNLRKVDLSYHCDDAGLAVLGAGCPLLEEIHLTLGPVTVDGLVALAEHCQKLTKVVLDYDRNEGRDFEAEDWEYFEGTGYGPSHAQAVADVPIIRSRLPHIRIECVEDFYINYAEEQVDDDDDDDDDDGDDDDDEEDEDEDDNDDDDHGDDDV